MKRRPSTRVISTRSAGHGGGLFTVHVEPDDYSLQSGPVEEQLSQGDSKAMNESTTFNTGPAVAGEALSITAGTYTPDEDVTATLADGRTIQLAVKGTPIPLAQAVALGLLDARGNKVAQVGPSETKETPKKGSAPSQGADTNTGSTPPPADDTKGEETK